MTVTLYDNGTVELDTVKEGELRLSPLLVEEEEGEDETINAYPDVREGQLVILPSPDHTQVEEKEEEVLNAQPEAGESQVAADLSSPDHGSDGDQGAGSASMDGSPVKTEQDPKRQKMDDQPSEKPFS
jgi:hypothetical protein